MRSLYHYLSVSGHWSCFWLLFLLNNAAMDTQGSRQGTSAGKRNSCLLQRRVKLVTCVLHGLYIENPKESSRSLLESINGEVSEGLSYEIKIPKRIAFLCTSNEVIENRIK